MNELAKQILESEEGMPWKEKYAILDKIGQELTSLKVSPIINRGRVTGLGNPRYNETPLTPEQLQNFGIDPNNIGYVDAHPEGSDRGGYVPFVAVKVGGTEETLMYDEIDGEWRY